MGECSGKPWRLFSRLDRGKNRACLTACWRGSSASPGAIGPRDKQREKPALQRALSFLMAWPCADTGRRATVRNANVSVPWGAAKPSTEPSQPR